MPDTFRITGNLPAVIEQLRKARESIERDMRASEARIADRARQLAELGINLGVYFTAPGKVYVRTNDLINLLDVKPVQGGPGLYGVWVTNSSEHATQVELGSYANELPEAAAQAQAQSLGVAYKPLYLERSGANYTQPNPAHTRATVWASYALADAFQKALAKHLK